ITDEATLTLTPSSFREPIHRVKWVARIAPTPIMPSTSFRVSASREARFARTNGTRIRDARPSRYRAIVMKGDVDQEMKMAEKDTDTTARAVAACGRPGTGPGRTGLDGAPAAAPSGGRS